MIFLQILVIAAVLALGFLVFSRRKPKGCAFCGKESESNIECNCSELIAGKEKKYLLFLTELPLGSTFQQVKMAFPQAAEIKGERNNIEPGEKTELNIPLKIAGRTAYINFVFEDRELAEYYFWLKDISPEESFNIFNSIKKFYNDNFQSVTQNNNEVNKNLTWVTEEFKVILKYIEGDMNAVSWGFKSIKK